MSFGKDVGDWLFGRNGQEGAIGKVAKLGEEVVRTGANTVVKAGTKVTEGAGDLLHMGAKASMWAGDKVIDAGENVVDFVAGTNFADQEDTGYKNAMKAISDNQEAMHKGAQEARDLSTQYIGGDFSKSYAGGKIEDIAAEIAGFLFPVGAASKAGATNKIANALTKSKSGKIIVQVSGKIRNPKQSSAFLKEVTESIAQNGGKLNSAKIIEIASKYDKGAREGAKLFMNEAKNARLIALMDKIPAAEKASLLSKYPKLSKAIGLVGVTGFATANNMEDPVSAGSIDLPPTDENEELEKLAKEFEDGEGVAPEIEQPENQLYKRTVKKEIQDKKIGEGTNLNMKESVSDTMRALGVNNSIEARKKLYENIIGKPYQGTADQNIALKKAIEDMDYDLFMEKMKDPLTM